MRTLPQWYRDEREKLKGYGLMDRLRYIWQYYRLWIIGIGFVLGFTVYAVWNYVTVPGEIHFYGILSNTYAQLGEGSDFYWGFVRKAGYDLDEGVVELDCANYCKPSGRATGNTYYEKLISMLDGHVDDIWIAEAEDVIAVGETGRLMDLDRDTTGALEKYADRFVYCTPLREDYSPDPVPIGIDLAGTALADGEFSPYPGGAVLAINAYTQRLDQVPVFLEYIFEYQP